MFKILITLLVSTQAQAFTLNNNVSAAFDQKVVKVNVDDRACTNVTSTPAQLLDYAKKAVEQYWNKVPTSNLSMKEGSLIALDNKFNTDPVCQVATDCVPNPDLVVASDITIACNNDATNFSDPGVLGVSLPNNITTSKINGAIILINDTAGNPFNSSSESDKIATIAHEIGHALGLGHSEFETSLMFYSTGAKRKKLGWDDHDGVTYLYPAEQPVSCSSIELVGTPKNGMMTMILTMLLTVVGFRLSKSYFSQKK